MTKLWQFITANPALVASATAALSHFWSIFAGSLDMPDAKDGHFYRFAFKFANRLAGNYARAAACDDKQGS